MEKEISLEILKVLNKISNNIEIFRVFIESDYEKYKKFKDVLSYLREEYGINENETVNIDNVENINTYGIYKSRLMSDYGLKDIDIDNFERLEKQLEKINK